MGVQVPVQVCKEKSEVFLRENRSNNIWVNSNKVGKDKATRAKLRDLFPRLE